MKTSVHLAALVFMLTACPDEQALEFEEEFRASPSVCMHNFTWDCRYDRQGHGCLPNEVDACSIPTPVACIDAAENCLPVALGDVDCAPPLVNACLIQP